MKCNTNSYCHKKFSKVHYEQFDKPAKVAAISFFSQFGFDGHIPPNDKYKEYDIIIHNSNNNLYYLVEVEVKNVWTKSGKWQG